MELAFNAEKLCFYSDIRKDDLVKRLGAESRIREVGELMVDYVKHFNRAAHYWHDDALKVIRLACENLEEALAGVDDPECVKLLSEVNKIGIDTLGDSKYVPTILNFNDFRAMAYAVGTYRDDRGFLKKIISRENPLDPILKKYAEHYLDFQNGGSLRVNYFDEDIREDIVVAMSDKSEVNSVKHSLNKIINKSSEYANRQGSLLRLADLKNSIIGYYAKQGLDLLERAYGGDTSWATSCWGNDDLDVKDIDRVTGYFKRMAEINGFRFKLLHSTYFGIRGDSSPFERTERVYQNLMDHYYMSGCINSRVVSTKADSGVDECSRN